MPLRWGEHLDRLKVADELMKLTWAPQDERLRAELYRQLLMNLSLGYFLYFQADADHPDWTPFLNSVFLLQPNPDDTYFYAPVRGDGVYRIAGERGSVKLLTFTVGCNMMGMTDQPGRLLDEYDADELEIGPDGRFEILFSAERPGDPKGNWRRLHAEAEFILVRQRSYDWGNERDARFAIERVDGDPLKPRMPAAQIDGRVQGLVAFAERLTKQWLTHQNRMRERDLVNKLEFFNFAGGVRAQQYWDGIFEIEADEALILETDVPERHVYWNVQLNDPLWNTIEYVYRQSGLNGHQARLDSDGRFRAVLSLEDPGVPNWLDTGGYNVGTLVGRWYGCSTTPMPTLKKVKLREVRKHLPGDTPLVSREQREAALRVRRAGGQLRRRW